MNNKLLILFFLIMLSAFSLANTFTCDGGVTNTGFFLENEGWQRAPLLKCNSTFNLTKIVSDQKWTDETKPTWYYSKYVLNNVGLTAISDNQQALTIPINLPNDFKNAQCNLQAVAFNARAQHATGIAIKHTYASSQDYLNSLITNYSNTTFGSNCVSKTLLPIGKHSMLNYARYGGWYSGNEVRYCSSWDLKNPYINNQNFSISIHNVADGGGTFLLNPEIYFFYERETDAQFCARLSKNCGSVTAQDSCGNTRTVNCGTCSDGTCGGSGIANVCGCDGVSWYLDLDNDGYYPTNGKKDQCGSPGVGWSTTFKSPGDCNDNDANINPSKTETCNGVDDNCSGVIDSGFECSLGSASCTNTCTFITRNTETCSGSIPSNATANNVSNKFTQKYNGTSWQPLTKNYSFSQTAQECTWKCNSGFVYNTATGQCASDLISTTCIGSIPQNAIWDDSGQNGSYSYQSGQTNPQKQTHFGGEVDCRFKCNENFVYSNGLCVSNQRIATCDLSETSGILPNNAKWNDLGKNGFFTQTWNGSTFAPENISAKFNSNPDTCTFYCEKEFETCSLDEKIYCGDGRKICQNGNLSECLPGFSAVQCNQNEFCDRSASSCVACATGTANCDADLTNGCETKTLDNLQNCGGCGIVCNSGEQCQAGKCINPDVNLSSQEEIINIISSGPTQIDNNQTNNNSELNRCYFNNDCSEDQQCSGGYCLDLVCATGFEISNNECVCGGTICSNTCYKESGVCCQGKWNPVLNSCIVSILAEEEIVSRSGDLSALNLITSAKRNISDGEVLKGKTEALLAQAKVNNKEVYELAKLAVDNDNYNSAYDILTKNDLTQSQSSDDFSFIILVIFVILAVIGYFIFKKIKGNNEDYLE